MTEELQHLWELRGLDDEVAAVRASLQRFPDLRRTLDHRVTADQKHLEEIQARMLETQKKRRQIERDIEAVDAQEKKFQSQLPLVKKNEEYTALLHEIAGAKKKRSDLETEVLVLMDEEERTNLEKGPAEKALAEAKKEAAARGAEIDREEQTGHDQIGALDARRERHLAALPPGTRTRYERIRGSREGRAVVPVAKGACGGCYRGLPPQMLNEARRGDRLLTCEGCGRLLIWPPEAAA